MMTSVLYNAVIRGVIYFCISSTLTYVGLPSSRICYTGVFPDINHLGQAHRLITWLAQETHHLPFNKRPRRLSLHSLSAWRLRGDLIAVQNNFRGGLDRDPIFFLAPFVWPGQRGHHSTVHESHSLHLMRYSAMSVWFVKYWNGLLAVTAPSVSSFKLQLDFS